MATRKSVTVQLDGTQMKGKGGSVRLPEDDYKVKITAAEKGESQAGNTMITLSLKITEGPKKGSVIKDRLTLTENALWKVGALFEAMGKTYKAKVFAFDFGKLIGEELGVTVIDGKPYNGRIKSEVGEYVSLDVLGDTDDDEDEDEDEDVDDDDDDDEEDEDL